MSNEVTSKEYWDKYWSEDDVKFPEYDLSRGLFYSLDLLFRKYVQETRVRLGRKKLRVIDCGCGEGLILKYLCEQFDDLEVWGIEYSNSYYKTESMAKRLGYDMHLIKGDLLEGWDDRFLGYFDMVISIGLIEHFENPSGILEQMYKAVSSEGCLLTVIPNFNGMYNFLWKLYDRENYKYHVPIKQASLAALHNDLGLTAVKCYTLGPTTVPGVHETGTVASRLMRFITFNFNVYILRKLMPRQRSLDIRYPLSQTVACAGFRK